MFLADLVLKDKIFVYDLGGQRIGWANYDCKFSLPLQKILVTYIVLSSTNDCNLLYCAIN